MNVLIYGAGVIGSVYATKLAASGIDVSVYARSARLNALNTKGLLYMEKNELKKAKIKIVEKVKDTDKFDYVFVTIRYEQVETVLHELKNNVSKNIVTFVNNPKGYQNWEKIVGTGRIIPAFAGAGGEIKEDILIYRLTPKMVQPTTFGEINGVKSKRVNKLAQMMKTAKIPYSISKNMDAWQKSHLAMVTVLANGIYLDGGDNYSTAKNKWAIHEMSLAFKRNFRLLEAKGYPITPFKLKVFLICPTRLMEFLLKSMMNTKFSEIFINSHAQKAKSEMLLLSKDFLANIIET
ncbi:MAG: NAD(P)-binding domain-containing protein [Lactobacillales bacterium]|jgi:2-dehydropantoate 2-reductase|nr:NAD(P)-binding domain-containing protein [Lactobacillales bacterium]